MIILTTLIIILTTDHLKNLNYMVAMVYIVNALKPCFFIIFKNFDK